MDITKYFIKGQFSCRVDEQIRDMLNEHIQDFIPLDVPEAELGNKHFFAELARVATSKSVSLIELKKLRNEVEALTKIQNENRLNTDKFSEQNNALIQENNLLNEQLAREENENENLTKQLEEKTGIVSTASARKQNPRIVEFELSESEFEVTSLFCERLSVRAKKDISIPVLLFDLFWDYAKNQRVKLELPFLLSKKEVADILAKYH